MTKAKQRPGYLKISLDTELLTVLKQGKGIAESYNAMLRREYGLDPLGLVPGGVFKYHHLEIGEEFFVPTSNDLDEHRHMRKKMRRAMARSRRLYGCEFNVTFLTRSNSLGMLVVRTK